MGVRGVRARPRQRTRHRRQGVANPIAMILSGAMLLRHVNRPAAARGRRARGRPGARTRRRRAPPTSAAPPSTDEVAAAIDRELSDERARPFRRRTDVLVAARGTRALRASAR
jgi:hypothetical protein